MTVDELLDRHGLGDAGRWLVDYLPGQRWFAGKGQHLASVCVDDAAELEQDRFTLLLAIVQVRYTDGSSERYHVPLAIRAVARAAIDTMPEHLIAEFTRNGRPVAVYDALFDRECAAVIWKAIAGSETHRTPLGEVRCQSDGIVVGAGDAALIRPLGAEQSNTSLVRGAVDLLKCMRRIELAQSPEIEMTQALTRAGFAHIAAPLGVMEYVREGSDHALLGVVQPYLRNGVDGRALALISIREIYEEAELEGIDDDPELRRRAAEEHGASFIPESERLGTMTGQLHLTLAALREEHMVPVPVTEGLLDTWANTMTGEFDRLLAMRDHRLDRLRDRRAVIVAGFHALRGIHVPCGLAIRIHGDYHLGQMMRTDDGWTIHDFEGEPARPVSERRVRSSPLRDVAGMMRSFDYAAFTALAERVSPRDPSWPVLFEAGDAWAQANRTAFWRAYAGVTKGAGIVPMGDDAHIMCRAFELMKAVYEVGYEMDNRPDWVAAPLSFLLRESS